MCSGTSLFCLAGQMVSFPCANPHETSARNDTRRFPPAPVPMSAPMCSCARLRRRMARRSLRPHLNQIRGWVRQGRTDAWIAHQLEVTVQQIEQFKRENDLSEGDAPEAANG